MHLTRLDILLTQACLEYASDLLSVRINPETIHMMREAHPRKKALARYLQHALDNHNISESLENLVPVYDQYKLLRIKLNELKKTYVTEQWPYPGFFQTVQEGDSGSHILKIKAY